MNEKSNIINQWIEKADHDLGTAEIVFQHMPDYYDTIAFHCQQAVEKYLKALLLFYDIEFRKSHSLIYLLDLLSIKIDIDQEKYHNAIRLNSFGVQVRYPDKTFFLSREELVAAIEVVTDFRDYVFEKIDKKYE